MSFVKGVVTGAIGGIAGGAVKLACEAVVSPRSPGREAPPGILAGNIVRRTTGRELSREQRQSAAMGAHWLFSTLTGAVHGAIVEARPSLEATHGIPLGLALWAGMHEMILPLLHATPSLADLPMSEQVNECVTHCIYGFTVETTRRTLRAFL
jgi:putative membrane protein